MNETVVEEYDQLFGLTSKGKIKTWKVLVIDLKDGTAAVDQTYGELDGKLQTNRKIVREGKNLGKSNETSVIEQANNEAESKFTKKFEQEGYAVDKDNLRVPKLPMLAKPFDTMKHKIVYPCYVQPKLDGIRCFATKIDNDTIEYSSRKGKPFISVSHLTISLLDIMKIGDSWDGELYTPELSFQEITSAVKKEKDF